MLECHRVIAPDTLPEPSRCRKRNGEESREVYESYEFKYNGRVEGEDLTDENDDEDEIVYTRNWT